ncbi:MULTISPECIES: BamA/TamA family outer membrane protein [unclassified Thermosynechococcus]|uniref:BamA/TamA family outer membrane protein n=1 Tax=unclassified Thermosynechococcus TaxID=2622553 RepID=UPI0019FB475C|nr:MULTISPECIES: BamA/TamA family outer membrane protein [unclassified Thermosynechococcus]HIK34569.1 BamA/TamA family outer membrane protein [Thermosynechococcus sp. M98_K2018_005]HIK46998.1 BamA/TamA family outer membrane protein [Thermosynechococcus sp. M55_K2018_012]
MNNQLFSPVQLQPMGAALKTVAVAMATVAIALGPVSPSRGQQAPAPPETPPAATPTPPPVSQPPADEPQVLIAEVVVEGATPELEQLVYQVINTRPGSTTTRTQLQQDTNAIFATGFFADVNAVPSDTPLGVRITFVVRPYPVLRAVQVAGNQVLTQEKVNEIFAPQIGRTLNLRELQSGIEKINTFYKDNGYILGQVVGTPQVDPDGVVTLQVAEGVVEEVTYRFLNKEGEPTKQRTRDFVISREIDTQPGVVLNQNTVQADLRRLFELGLFEDVQVSLEPGRDPRKVNLILNIKERNTGSISAGAGYSSASGLFGTVAFQQNNLFGRNWKFGVEAQGGTEGEFLFDINFTDPWIKGDPYRTSYTVSAFNRLNVPFTFSNGPINVPLANGDLPRINRLGSAVFFTRPFTKDRDLIRTAWTGSLGLQYQRVTSMDGSFNRTPTDFLGNCLTFPDNGVCRGFNDLFTVQAAILRDLRNDPLRPTRGQVIRLGVDQSIPIGTGNILMNRVRGSYSFYIPVKFLRLEGPQTVAFNIQAGNIFGDLPPYESFTIGGANSVRGWEEGAIGSGRAFVQGTIEYRFPIFNIVGGALFVDGASLLGTQGSVPGQPGIVRGKPGEGLGYGGGLRVNTPLGNIRIDFGWNNEGGSAFSFGIGERF